MEWLNYHHLLYFWMVAKEGSVTAAAKQLRLSQPTISGQLKTLEESFGEELFTRSGRGLVLTEVGQLVFRYADEIFGLGRELMDTLRGRPTGRPARLHVGISDLVPKLVSHRILEPALRMDPAVQIICREDKTERLLADLAVHGLDLVLADEPISGVVRVKAFNHLLGECGVTFFGAPQLAKTLRGDFPECLNDTRFLLPTENTLAYRALEHWFERKKIRPIIVAEFEDTALLKVFGQRGEGFFAAPSVVEQEILRGYGVQVVGRTDEIRERFYAITVERRIKHPAIATISDQARAQVFGGEPST